MDLENLIIALKQSVETWASQGRKPIDQYEPGSISQESSTQNLTLAITPVDDLRQQYSKQLDDAWASEEYYAFTLPRERETKGIWQVIGGVVLVGVGVACIVATGGAAAPVVIGGAAMLFGYSEVIEGGQNAYYGSAGDMESKEFNPLRDTLFQGDQKVYDYAKNAVAFAASCMIPLGLAYSAGKLTLQSGLFIIGTEAASEGAGFLVNMAGEKMKLDPTLTMILGMAASIGTSALFCKFDKVFSITKNLPNGDITPPTPASMMDDIDDYQPVRVQHAVSSASQAQSVLDGIDPKYFNAESRFGEGFYVGGDSDTIVAELATHGNSAKYAISYDLDLSGQNVLDLTDPQVASQWDFIPQMTLEEECQEIGQLAKSQGYDAIVFQSYRGDAPNYVIFDNFGDILTAKSVSPIE